MIKNNLKIAWRNLWKHKFYTLINIFGLALSISCSIILLLFITYHSSFDNYHQNAKNIYRVVHRITFGDEVPMYDQGAPLALARDIKINDPRVKDVGILLRVRDINVSILQSDKANKKMFAEHENIGITDSHFFNLFDYDWEQGDKRFALNEPYKVVLSHGLAQKYFGSQDVVGKKITIDNKNTFTVTGVVKDHPANTDIKSDIFLSLSTLNNIYPEVANAMKNDWSFINSTNSVFVALQPSANPKDIEHSIVQMLIKARGADMAKWFHFMLLPLNEMHFDGRFAGVIQHSLLTILGTIALLLIIIACVNFINMATAQSFKRTKEIGTRKVLGSSPRAIFLQFITETGLIVVFAAAASLIIVIAVIPTINIWLQTQLVFDLFASYQLIACMIIGLIVITVVAGTYPGIVLSVIKPINALKNQISDSKQTIGFTRKGLIVGQNVIAQVLIIGTIIITLQVKFLKTTDLGFNKDNIVMVPIPDYNESKTDYFRNELLTNPAIKNVSFCYRAPFSSSGRGGSIKYDNRNWEKFPGHEITGDANYIKTFGLQLIAGRNIAESDTAREFLVNEAMMYQLGVKDPQQMIGRHFVAGNLSNHPGVIAGVVKNFHAKSLYNKIQPEYISTFRKLYQYAGVKVSTSNSKIIDDIKNKWQTAYPNNVFEYGFFDEQIADFYQKEELFNKLITTSAVIAIAISCLGLLGLISLLTLQRIKEIGIRKVLGASVTNLTLLLSGDFLKLVLLAIVLSTPIAWLIMNKYLQNFAYRIDISWWMFALTGILSLLVAFTTICFQSIKAALSNPVKSLKSE